MEKITGKILSLFLMLTMVLMLAPTGLFAADSWTLKVEVPENYTISLYENGSTNALGTFSKTTTSLSVSAAEKTYTYVALDANKANCGSGKITVAKDNTSLTFCTVDFSRTLKNEASGYRMTVVRHGDENLTYTASESNPGFFVLPKLCRDDYYDYKFIGLDNKGKDDATFWGSYGDVWVYDNTYFKGMNLSDVGTFIIFPKTTMSIEVPHGAELKLCHRNRFYLPLEILAPEKVSNGLITDTYTFEVPKNAELHYELKLDGYIKYSHTFNTGKYAQGKLTVDKSVLKSEEEYNSKDFRDLRDGDLYANILGNVGNNRFVELAVGEYFDLYLHRDWQAINNGTGNYYVDPIFHYEVVAGDSVTINGEYYAGARINAVKNGTSIVRVTYDAMEFDDTFYSRLWEERTLFIVFNVGGHSEGLKTGITHTEGDTVYYTKSVNGEDVEDAKGQYTFTPSVDGGGDITVETHAPIGRDGTWKDQWTTWQPDEKGTYTIDLADGSTIVKISSGDKVAYHVIRAHGVNVKLYNATTEKYTTKFNVGDNVQISFDGLIMPLPKLGAVYNPGFPDKTYLVYDLNGQEIESDHTQYGIRTVNTVRFRIEDSGTYHLTNGKIHSTSIGEGAQAHWRMTRGGMTTAYNGGDSGESINGLFCSMPDITIEVPEPGDTSLQEALLYNRLLADTYTFGGQKVINPFLSVGNREILRKADISAGEALRHTMVLPTEFTSNEGIIAAVWPTNAEDCNVLMRYWSDEDPTVRTALFAGGKSAKTDSFIKNTQDGVYLELVLLPKDGVNALPNSYSFVVAPKNVQNYIDKTYYINSVTPYLKSLLLDIENIEDCSPIQGLLKAEPTSYTDKKGQEHTLDFGYGFLGSEHNYTSTLPSAVDSFKLNVECFTPQFVDPAEVTLYVNGEAQPSVDTPITIGERETVKLEVMLKTTPPQPHSAAESSDGYALVCDYTGPTEQSYTVNVTRLSVAEEVTALIDKIGTVSLDRDWVVTKARKAYDALTPEQQSNVTNADKLFAAEERLADLAAVQPVEELINAIGEVTKNSGDDIAEARAAFDELTAAQQELVKKREILLAAEKAYAELTKVISPFTDVKTGDWFFGDVIYVAEQNLFKGTSDTTFSPQDVMTRAMFVTVLGRNCDVADASAENAAATAFADVDAKSYYASHVKWAVEKGITKGISNDRFAPNNKISRQDMATMMLRYAQAMNIQLPAADKALFADDADIADYAKEAVYTLKAAGIINGKGGNQFDPKGSTTRAEVAAVLHRFLTYNYADHQKVDDTNAVIVDIEKFTIGQGFVMEPTVVKLEEGDTVATVLQRVAAEKGLELECQTTDKGFYLASLKDNGPQKAKVPQYLKDAIAAGGSTVGERAEKDWLGQFDYTPSSGWMVWVNHYEIPVSAGAWDVKAGDVIRWQFTLYGLGKDLGSDSYGDPFVTVGKKDALVHAMAVASKVQKAGKAYENAVKVMEKMDATQAEIDAATAALQ